MTKSILIQILFYSITVSHAQIVVAVLVAAVSADHINKNAQVRSFSNEITEDGRYTYGFDTSNGIAVAEAGAGGQVSNGNAQWVSPEGEQIRLTWVADNNGYHPQGSHLPVAPPTPALIARAVQWILANPTAEERQLRAQRAQGLNV